MKQKFIKTTDADVANQLIDFHFQVVNKDSDTWTFLNKSTINFNQIDLSKCYFTNILSI